MPKINWNVEQWDVHYNWHMQGEEWSRAWGSSEAQWFGSLYPRLHSFLPARRILEIAPGFGRWTRYLLEYCDEYTGVDLSRECVAACKQRFGGHAKPVEFFQNDGLSLAAATGHYDFVFSFDSLVHADREVFEQYIPAIMSLLTIDGVAILHHSNFSESGEVTNKHHRSENVTASYMRSLVQQCGGSVLVQELLNWGGAHPIDCLTLLKRGHREEEPVILNNLKFMEEANIIKNVINRYILGPIK